MRAEEVLRWPIEHPIETLLALTLVTVLAPPLRRIAARLGELLATPSTVVESHLVAPALAGVNPWPLDRAIAAAHHLVSSVNLPLQTIGRQVLVLARHLPRAVSGPWPLLVAGSAARLGDAFRRVSEAADSAVPLAVRQVSHSKSQLGQPVGHKIVGAIIFGFAAVAFALADAALITDSFVALTPGVTTTGVPDFLKTSLVFAQSAASFLSIIMLGLILGDLLGITHIGPWADARGVTKFVLTVIAVLLFTLVVVVSAAISLWRANEIQQFLSPELRGQLGAIARGWVQPLMLVVSAIIFSGAINTFILLWLVVSLVLTGALLIVRFLSGLAADIAVPLIASLVRVAVAAAIAAALIAGLTGLILGAVVVGALGYLATGLSAFTLLGAALLWTWLWRVVGAAAALVAQGIRALVALLQGSIDVLAAPGTIVWNWFVSMTWLAERLHLRPIGELASPVPSQPKREALVGKAVIR